MSDETMSDQSQDQDSQSEQGSQESGGSQEGGASSGKITLNAAALKDLQEALGKLDNFPQEAPQGFDVIYIECEGKVGDQLVTAQYEDNEWSLILEGSDSSSSSDEEQEDSAQDESAEEESSQEEHQYS